MSRKRKGRPVHGWLVIDKPAGITSTAVVNKLRWAFGAKKAGHAGTLDPAATGILAVAFGEATKTIPFITDAMKAYRFTVRWGSATNTDDAEGEIIAQSDLRPDAAMITEILPDYIGDIMQVPPQFSAVKIDGERAYARARDGEASDIAARPLYVEDLRLIATPDADTAEFELICGKGGYVRAIARELGAALGCHGHVLGLRRIWSGPFELDDALPFARFEEEGPGNADLDALLLPVEVGLADLPEQKIGDEGAARIRNGNPGPVTHSDLDFGAECWVSYHGRAMAIGTYRAGMVAPSKVFVYE